MGSQVNAANNLEASAPAFTTPTQIDTAVGDVDDSAGDAFMTTKGVTYYTWADQRNDPNHPEIYFAYSQNQGSSWSANIKVADNDYNPPRPDIAVCGDNIVIIWHDFIGGDFVLRSSSSQDLGQTWDGPYTLADGWMAKITTDPLCRMHVTWDSSNNIYYGRLVGNELKGQIKISGDNSNYKNDPDLAVDPAKSDIHVIWKEKSTSAGSYYNGMYTRSLTEGRKWSTPEQFNKGGLTSNQQGAADIAVGKVRQNSARIYVVWTDQRSGSNNIYLNAKHNGLWGADQVIKKVAYASDSMAQISITQGRLIVAWEGDNQTRVARSRDGQNWLEWTLNLGGDMGVYDVEARKENFVIIYHDFEAGLGERFYSTSSYFL